MHEMLARTVGYAFLIYRYRYIKAELFYYCINATYCHQLFLSFGGFAPGPPPGEDPRTPSRGGSGAPPAPPPTAVCAFGPQGMKLRFSEGAILGNG